MSYTWIEPKTDWTSSDYFTYTDYNRIRNNLLYLNEQINGRYPETAKDLNLGNPKTGYINDYRPSQFNAFEDALISFYERTKLDVNLGKQRKWKDNGQFIGFQDLNRIESCCFAWNEATKFISVKSVKINETLNPIVIWTKITFDPEKYQLTATITPSNADNKNVTWTSSQTSVVSVSNKGLVTRVGHGTSTITVTTENGGKKDTRSIEVHYGFDTAELNYTSWVNPTAGQTKQLAITYSPNYAEGYEVTWSSSDTSVATVSNSGLVTCVHEGEAKIKATIIEPHFDNRKVELECEITAVAVTGVTIDQPTNPINIWTKTAYTPETFTLTATVTPSNAGDKAVTWESSNTNVATVDSNGKVTRVGHGTCSITVKTHDGNKTDSRTVKVNYGIDNARISPASWVNPAVGETKQLTIITEPSYATGYNTTWTSGDLSVATVSDGGLVTIVSQAGGTIIATIKEPKFNNNTITKTMNIKNTANLVYGMRIDFSVENPYDAVTYTDDAIGKTPAYYDGNDYANFKYGDWAEDEFFMPRPCMLRYDGTVDYYLDPNDYSKKEDGTASDIANPNYQGNAMMEWGRDDTIIWVKAYYENNNTNVVYVKFASSHIEGYEPRAFINGYEPGDHFYTSIYEARVVDNKFRSLSNESLASPLSTSSGQSAHNITWFNDMASVNGNDWAVERYVQFMLITLLRCLIMKTATIAYIGDVASESGSTGQFNTGGLFCRKMFGMERVSRAKYMTGLGSTTYGITVVYPSSIVLSRKTNELNYVDIGGIDVQYNQPMRYYNIRNQGKTKTGMKYTYNTGKPATGVAYNLIGVYNTSLIDGKYNGASSSWAGNAALSYIKKTGSVDIDEDLQRAFVYDSVNRYYKAVVGQTYNFYLDFENKKDFSNITYEILSSGSGDLEFDILYGEDNKLYLSLKPLSTGNYTYGIELWQYGTSLGYLSRFKNVTS